MCETLREPVKVLKSLSEKTTNKEYKFKRLYRNLYNPEFYFLAYKNISQSQGSMTPGVDGKSLDGMSEKRINALIESLKDFSYHPNPARRVYIEKKNSTKKRPLGIPSTEDKLVQEGVTITALVPAMVTVCMEMLEWDEDYDISSLRILQVGGAMLEDSLADKIIEEWPCKLMQVFGTAEGLLSFTSPEDEGSLIARCQGTPVSPADEVKIVDEEDKAVPEGVFGELLSRGPYTIDGYYMAEEANKKSFTPDGFYRTGDKAMWTKDRRLRLGGRIKEQINRAGEKIMPSEIEAYLCRHSKIKEAAVVGVPDETLGNRICAFLVTDDEAGIDLQEIHRFLREIGVAAYKMPDQIERVETWPLTSVGKIDKKALERMAQEK